MKPFEIDPAPLVSQTKDTLESADEVLKSDASKFFHAMAHFFKEAAAPVKAFAQFLNIIDCLKELKNLPKADISTTKKWLYGAGYILHLASSGIAFAAVCGAAIVAAPIMGLVVGGTAMLKNLLDFNRNREKIETLEQDIEKHKTDLKQKNINFDNNVALYEEIKENSAKIQSLTAHKQELEYYRHKISRQIERLEAGVAPKEKEEMDAFKDLLEAKRGKNKILAQYYGLQGEKPSALEMVDKVKVKLKKLEQQREQLQAKLATDPKNQDFIDKLKDCEEDIQTHQLLQKHFEKIDRLQNLLQDAQTQLAGLDEKYDIDPKGIYKNSPDRAALKDLERTYLTQRIESLTTKIKNKQDPDNRQGKKAQAEGQLDILQEADHAKEKSEKIQKFKDLTSKLDSQIQVLDAEITKKTKERHEKSKYFALFMDKDPKLAISDQAIKLVKQHEAMLDKKHELILAKSERYKKIKKIGFSAVTIGLGICLCVPVLWPAAAALTITMSVVGAVAGLSSLYDKYKQKQHEKKLQKNKTAAMVEITGKLGDTVQETIKAAPDNAPSSSVSVQAGEKPSEQSAALIEQLHQRLDGDGSKAVDSPTPHIDSAPSLVHSSQERSASLKEMANPDKPVLNTAVRKAGLKN